MPRAVKKKATAAAGAVKKPKNSKLYAMPEKIPEGTILIDLAKAQWRIGPSIGVGGFGEIYSACRVGTKNYDFVVKCEPHGNGPLFVEMHFYMRNARLEDIQKFQKEHGTKSLGMPYMVGNGSTDINGLKHRFIVMPRYGSNIQTYFLANGNRLPEGTVYRLALQMLDVYEYVHSCGYVHADLKGANILLGFGKGGGAQAYLVDFGLASHYTTKDFKPDPKKMHNGTIEYTSRDAHLGVPTMRSDFEILGYNLIEWLGVKLPWVSENVLATPAKVQKSKEEFMANVSAALNKLFAKSVPAAIADFLKYVAKMEYNEKPDYAKCRKMFVSALATLKIPNSGDLNFKVTAASDNTKTTNSKAKSRAQTKKVTPDTSLDELCASDDDDGDVFFVPKVSPKKRRLAETKKTSPVLKTTPKTVAAAKPKKVQSPPTRKVLASKISPKIARKAATAAKISPQKTTPRKRQSPEDKQTHKTDTPATTTTTTTATNTNTSPSKTASSRTTRNSPHVTKANINFSPAISIKQSGSRLGNTIINDGLTPNPRAGKTYEFNFELDVSMDANVVVNVKRKKKTRDVSVSSSANTKQKHVNGSSSHSASREGGDTPVTRIKVRKLDDENGSSSPRTPAVTVKKSKRLISPR